MFYLHHTSIDRLVSLWTALNPGVWVTPGDSGEGTIALPSSTAIDKNTGMGPSGLTFYLEIDIDQLLLGLAPFWNTETTFWPSSRLQDTRKLGYTYPDFNGLDMGNTYAVREAISDRVNLLYGLDVFGAPSAPVPSKPPRRPDHTFWDWTAHIKYKMFELESTFFIFMFLGEVPRDPRDWHTSPNYIKSSSAMVNKVTERCANCTNKKLEDVVLEQFAHLNHAIVKHSGLRSLEPHVVEPYLTNALQWRVQQVPVYSFLKNICQCVLMIRFLSINSVQRRRGRHEVF